MPTRARAITAAQGIPRLVRPLRATLLPHNASVERVRGLELGQHREILADPLRQKRRIPRRAPAEAVPMDTVLTIDSRNHPIFTTSAQAI
jgi:hypothetical protein